MRIDRFDTAVIQANFDWTIVRLGADDGTTGLGECFFAPGLSRVLREFGELVVGCDPRDSVALVSRLVQAASGAGGMSGVLHNAISGIEAALLDLNARSLGIPLHRLLGGRYRDRIRIYADCHGGGPLESYGPLLVRRQPIWSSTAVAKGSLWERRVNLESENPGAYAARAKAMVAQGFTALKFDIDVPNPHAHDEANGAVSNRELELMVELVRAVRNSIGTDVDVAVDCHWRYATADAIRIARALESFGLLWLEDPVAPDNREGLAIVSQKSGIPLATGENLYGTRPFRELFETHSVAIATPDLQKVGGLRMGQRIAECASEYGINCAFHNISGPIGTMASCHVAATVPNFLVLEHHANDVPFFDALVGHDGNPLIRDGYVEVSDLPGLGVDLDIDVARRYAKPGTSFFGTDLPALAS